MSVRTSSARSDGYGEELILYGVLIVIGVIPVAIASVRHARFGGEATIGLLMLCAGAIGIIAHTWRARRN